ncbi:hypothetical protein LO762_30530 [Actinocorallia sp. API 0066]|uniref:hypothetical protein n=1 Tax=Actinocorallia sp. API 0066 TaxID=2896846 RepID=UPI001E3E308D|nr:hypothetical protein [Actinocorallia sp. API 0066]MCD0453488.1 hypothetical protein [Actinocorallia sp. API 0066]
MFRELVAAAVAGATALYLAGARWADGNDRWRLVSRQPSLAHGEVLATGPHNAWAFGWEPASLRARLPLADGPHRPTAFHWDGAGWAEHDLPVGDGQVSAAAASSPADVWVTFGDEEGREVSVLRWDGRGWTTVRRLPGDAGRIAALAADDVWVFGDRRAWHFDGAAWAERSVPFHAFRVAARSPAEVWAVDGAAVHRFDGGRWSRIDLSDVLPKTPSDGSPSDGPRLTGVSADTSGVWVTGEIGVSSFLVFDTGSGWRFEDISAKAGRLLRDAAPVPDGRGGHWFLGSTDVNGDDSALAHRDPVGRWTRTPSGGHLSSLAAPAGGPVLATGTVGPASGVFRDLP